MDEAQQLNEEQNGFRHWWEPEYEPCPQHELCTMLRDNGDVDELVWLLLKPQWIIKRLQNAGIYGVDQDIDVALSALSPDSKHPSAVAQCLKVIANAARMSALAVAANPSEAPFQLYGRLLRYANNCQLAKSFVDEIEHIAERPWFRPSEGFLTPAGCEALEQINVKAPVMCLNVTNDCIQMFCQHELNYVEEYSFTHGTRRITYLNTEQICAQNMKRALCTAISSSGNHLVTGHACGALCVWDSNNGTLLRHATNHSNDVVSVSISANGKRMISASLDGTVRAWNMTPSSLRSRLAPLSYSTTTPGVTAISPDGLRMACARGRKVMVMRDSGGTLVVIEPRKLHEGEARCLAISNDGEWLASASASPTSSIESDYFKVRHVSRVRLWNMLSGVQVAGPFHVTLPVISVAFSADGTRLALGRSDGSVELWDVQRRRELMRPFYGHSESVHCVALSADGRRVVSGADDGSVRVWDTTCSTRDAPCGELLGVTFSADGRHMACASKEEEWCVTVWRTGALRAACQQWSERQSVYDRRPFGFRSGGEVPGVFPYAVVTFTDFFAAAFSPDHKRLATANERFVRLWDLERGRWPPLATVEHALRDEPCALWWSADGKRVAALSKRGEVRAWELVDAKRVDEGLQESAVPLDGAERVGLQPAWRRPRVLKHGASVATGDEFVVRCGDEFFTVRRNSLAFCDLV